MPFANACASRWFGIKFIRKIKFLDSCERCVRYRMPPLQYQSSTNLLNNMYMSNNDYEDDYEDDFEDYDCDCDEEYSSRDYESDTWDALTDGQYGDMPDDFYGDYSSLGY